MGRLRGEKVSNSTGENAGLTGAPRQAEKKESTAMQKKASWSSEKRIGRKRHRFLGGAAGKRRGGGFRPGLTHSRRRKTLPGNLCVLVWWEVSVVGVSGPGLPGKLAWGGGSSWLEKETTAPESQKGTHGMRKTLHHTARG